MNVGYYKDRLSKLETIASRRKQQKQDYSAILDNHIAVKRWLADNGAMPCPHRLFAIRDELSQADTQAERKAITGLIADIVLARLKELELFTGYMSDDLDHAITQDPVSVILIDPAKFLYGSLTPECHKNNCLRFEVDRLITVKEYEQKRRQEWDSYCDDNFSGSGKHASTDDSSNQAVLSVHHSAAKYE